MPASEKMRYSGSEHSADWRRSPAPRPSWPHRDLPPNWDRNTTADNSLSAWVAEISAREPRSSKEILFQELADTWIKETARHSVLMKIVMHPSYQRIIGLGPIAIPWILRRMKAKPNHWFWALDALAQGLSPAEGCESLIEATDAWIRWGEDKGYISADVR
jgi:hypothetical protein